MAGHTSPRLVHFSETPLVEIWPVLQQEHPPQDFAPKPRGLWVSDENAYGWRQWCVDNDFGSGRFKYTYEIELAADANILRIFDAIGIDEFTAEYGTPSSHIEYWADWPRVAQKYQGILITPYIEARRLWRGADWYYPWDCASGCIWDPEAIASYTRLSPDQLEPIGPGA